MGDGDREGGVGCGGGVWCYCITLVVVDDDAVAEVVVAAD